MKKLIIPAMILITMLVSCGSAKPDVYLLRNQKLFSVFPDKEESFLSAERYFRKSDYRVRYIAFSKFADLNKEFDIVKNRTKSLPEGAIFFMDNLSANVFVGNLGSYQSASYKLISYNSEPYHRDTLPSQTMICFYPSEEVIFDSIISVLLSLSQTNDLSDTMYIYSMEYTLPLTIAELFKIKYPEAKLTGTNNKNSVKNAIVNSGDIKHYVVFCCENNSALSELNESKAKGVDIIEIMSEYGKSFPLISHSVTISEDILVDHALHSRQMRQYLANMPIRIDSENDKTGKKLESGNVLNIPLEHDNIMKVTVRNPNPIEHKTFKLEEKIKQRNELKEKEKRENEKNGSDKANDEKKGILKKLLPNKQMRQNKHQEKAKQEN